MSLFKVVVIGEVCNDILMHNPKSVKVLGKNVWAEDITITAGGSATYVSAALAHLGVNVRLCSSIGDDDIGKQLINQLQDFNINCDMVNIVKAQQSTCSIVICDGDEKDFIGCSPMLPITLPEIEMVSEADFVYIAGYMIYPELWTDEAYSFFKEIKKRNIPIALDGQFIPIEGIDLIAESKIDRIFPLTDVFFAARKEMRQLVGSDNPKIGGKRLIDLGCKTAVLKQGADGCVIVTRNDSQAIKGYPVDTYDTVGSGDVFGASYCYGFLNRWENRRSAQFATVFTALSLKRYKKSKNYPTLDKIQQILSKNK